MKSSAAITRKRLSTRGDHAVRFDMFGFPRSPPAVPSLLPDSVILVEAGGRVSVESDAVLRIAASLDGPVRHLARLRIVPRVVRDAVYRLVARTRYRIFGRHDVCEIPAPWLRERFLDGA